MKTWTTYQRGEFGDEGDIFVPCAQDQVLVPGDNAKKEDLDDHRFKGKPGCCRGDVAQQ